MNEKNFAEGYNVLTGEVDNHPANNQILSNVSGGGDCPDQARGSTILGLLRFPRLPRHSSGHSSTSSVRTTTFAADPGE